MCKALHSVNTEGCQGWLCLAHTFLISDPHCDTLGHTRSHSPLLLTVNRRVISTRGLEGVCVSKRTFHMEEKGERRWQLQKDGCELDCAFYL